MDHGKKTAYFERLGNGSLCECFGQWKAKMCYCVFLNSWVFFVICNPLCKYAHTHAYIYIHLQTNRGPKVQPPVLCPEVFSSYSRLQSGRT